MCRRLMLAAVALFVGCAPAPKVVDNSQNVNSGVDIVPQAILAAEKVVPSTKPSSPADPDLIDVINRSDEPHYHLIEVLRKSGMVGRLQDIGPLTLLAPTDDAFEKFPPGVLQRMLLPEHHAELVNFVKVHLLRGRIDFNDLLETKGQVPTLSGQIVLVNGLDGKVMINDANVIRTDTAASNGIVQWMDNCLIPQ